MRTRNVFLGCLLALITASPAWAADAAKGKTLHEQHCIQCHAQRFGGQWDKIYTRADRKMDALKKLTTQVGFCNQQLGLQWFDEDVADVTAYLNETFYHVK